MFDAEKPKFTEKFDHAGCYEGFVWELIEQEKKIKFAADKHETITDMVKEFGFYWSNWYGCYVMQFNVDNVRSAQCLLKFLLEYENKKIISSTVH